MIDSLIRYFVLWTVVWLSQPIFAAPVSEQKAMAMASSFLNQKGRTLSVQKPSIRHAMPGYTVGDVPYHVFNVAEGGFIVMSGDDATVPVLGYAENGAFDADSLPEGLQFLLRMYAEQIARVRDLGLAPAVGAGIHYSPVRRSIEPLLTTSWNQGNPYNLLCPDFYNSDGSVGGKCATGCVATAVAQVMAYYRYPQATKRTIPGYVKRFETDNGDVSVQLRNIPAGSVIDWDNMLDVYHGDESEAQQTAVAQLMYWVGLGSKMDYGPSSAAGFPNAVNALVRYFGYDDGTHIESRSRHSIESWNNLLYNELLTGHPIAFAGTNSGGAHAFVVDGYDVEGLYHLNWGWGGMDNGYFRIDVLDPDDNSGIGASNTTVGYNMGQDAIIGLRLPDEVDSPAEPYKLTVNDWEIRNGNVFFANYVNWSGVNADWNIGIGRMDEDGKIYVVGSYMTAHINTDTFVGQEFVVRGLPEGTYRIVPVSKRTDDREWQTHVNPAIRYVEANVNADGAVTLTIHPIEMVEVTDISFPGNHKRGEAQMVNAAFRNLGEEYCHEVHLFAGLDGQTASHVGRTAVTMPVDGESNASFSFTPSQNGTWTVTLAADDQGRDVLGQASVEITEQGVDVAENLRYVSLSVSNRSNEAVYGSCMQGKVKVLNQGQEPFEGTLRLWLFKLADNGYYYGASSVYVPMTVLPGKTEQAPFFFENLELNATYAMSILYEHGGDIQDGGLRQVGRTQKGIVCWLADNTLNGMAPASFINTPVKALAVDMRGMGSAVSAVHPNSNPNTLYILDEDADLPEGLEHSNVVFGTHAAALSLADGSGFLSPLAFTADKVEFSVIPEKAKWQTLVLPFSALVPESGLHVMQFSEVDGDGKPAFSEVSSVERHIPCVIWSETGEGMSFSATDAAFSASRNVSMVVGNEQIRFCGTTTGESLSQIWTLNEGGNAFVYSADQVRVAPFRAFFKADGLFGDMPLPPGGVDGVESPVARQQVPEVFYNLSGQRVEKPQRGVYITKNKKIILW